jgi:hypothetical protein
MKTAYDIYHPAVSDRVHTGQIYHGPNTGGLTHQILLARVDVEVVCPIALDQNDGNRWRSSVVVEDTNNITEDEFRKLLGDPRQWTLVGTIGQYFK